MEGLDEVLYLWMMNEYLTIFWLYSGGQLYPMKLPICDASHWYCWVPHLHLVHIDIVDNQNNNQLHRYMRK